MCTRKKLYRHYDIIFFKDITMTQLIYCSKAKENVALEDVKDILDLSIAKNKEFNLSGMLIYNGTYFLQCIEGKDEYIKNLYANILKDTRHENIKLIGTVDILKRDFENWNMGYFYTKNEFNEKDDFYPYDMSFNDAKSVLMNFSKGL